MNDDSYDLHVAKAGSGPPLLLIHGFASSSFTWRHVVEAFRDQYTVWAIDLLGHGKSPKPSDAPYTIEQQSRLITDLIKQSALSNWRSSVTPTAVP